MWSQFTRRWETGGKTRPAQRSCAGKGNKKHRAENIQGRTGFQGICRVAARPRGACICHGHCPQRYFTAAGKGAICYHPSILPRHRGASAINWALIMGDKRTGLTVFWPDEGIDTGPILLQREVDIGADDTAGSLYFNRLFPMGVEAIVESVKLIEKEKRRELHRMIPEPHTSLPATTGLRVLTGKGPASRFTISFAGAILSPELTRISVERRCASTARASCREKSAGISSRAGNRYRT